ncbi:hypothetical protein FJTKL_15429 [Diaporthe vaccinii]|uniref:Uncharacterized protein n=1 Tax=Diaporthe vaccinii TaxID=105482 RepID=A0ABR4E507_9PEZI
MASAVETVYRPPELTSGTWTSWIPLVTPWSGHAPGCSTKFWQWNTDRSIVAWDPGFGISVSKDLRCVPEAATTAWDQDRLGSNSDTVVSIGPMTCPEAFSQVATSVMDASRTLVACCPSEYTFAQWKSPGNIGQCYSDVASGDILTVYTTDSKQSWVPDTRQINSSTTVIGAHINGWIFAEETPTPAAPAATESLRPGCSGGNTNSAVIFGIGVALAVVGVVVLAAGLVIMRRSRKALRRVTQSAVNIPNSRVAPSQDSSRYRPMHQPIPSHGGLFLPVPAQTRHSTPQPYSKEPQEMDASDPSS